MIRNGFFEKHIAVIITAIASFAAVVVTATQIWVTHVSSEKEFQLRKIQTAKIITEAGLQLGAKKDKEIDLDTRLAGITTLRLLASLKAPIEYSEASKVLLETYVRLNLIARKNDSFGVEKDRGITRPLDIVAAIDALQHIRKATGGNISVNLSRLDFTRMDLSYVDLEGFNLSFSKFNYARLGPKLSHTNFDFANLSYAAIWNADMSFASFHKTILLKSRLLNVDLAGTNIEEACNKNTTIFTVSGLTQKQSSLFQNYKELNQETP